VFLPKIYICSNSVIQLAFAVCFLKFVPNPQFDFLTSFAKKFNVPVEGGPVIIPPVMGTGSIRRIALSAGLKLIVHRYKLNQDFILKQVGNDTPNNLVSVIFHVMKRQPAWIPGKKVNPLSRKQLHLPYRSHQQTSIRKSVFPPTRIYTSGSSIMKDALKELLAIKILTVFVQTILNAEPGFLF